MSIEKEYSLSCDECGDVYPINGVDSQDVADMAGYDGWMKKRYFAIYSKNSNAYICKSCINKMS